MKRRDLLKGMASGLLSPLGVSATLTGALGLGLPQLARAADYRALVVVFLKGGYDGNDMLVPLDAGYNDYSKGRSDLALKKDELVPLGRGYAGGPLGMHPALKPLQSIYEQGRMAWVANIGAMVKPLTAAQWRNNEVAVPPFLMSHSEQVNIVQGWDPAEILNGWAAEGWSGFLANSQRPCR